MRDYVNETHRDEINRYMEADLCGIVAYHEEWGFYPKDQRKFVSAYIFDKRLALKTKFEAYKEAA